MSISPPTATATAPTAVGHQNYWCHECDMSVLVQSLSATTISPVCPHCRRDFLEQMDSFTPPPPDATNSFPNPVAPFFQPLPPLDHTATFPIPSTARSDDNFLLDSPYLQRLIQHLMTTNNHHRTTPTPPHYNSPASKNAIESLHHVTVDVAFLQKDPTIVCPVCKDQFVIDSEAKVLPCKHMYHSDCIIPWLEMNNSCPVCRYRLQSLDEIEIEAGERDGYAGPPRLDELLEDEEDLFIFRNTLRNVVRRHQLNNSNNNVDVDEHHWIGTRVIDDEFLFSPTQMGEAEGGSMDEAGMVGNHVERADSVETVSSWPRWPVVGSGSGDGEIGAGVSGSSRGEDDVDTVKV